MDKKGPSVAWIGAGGRMGYALVKRLLSAGYEVGVYNRTAEKVDGLVELGAVRLERIADASSYEAVFTTVSGDADLETVVLGAEGIVAGDGKPSMVIDMTTVSMAASARVREGLAEHGIEMLAAPVSGNAKVIEAGMLSIVASGPRDAFDQASATLDVLSRAVTYAGEGESARLVKICHNLYLGSVIEALIEVSVLAEKGGVSRADLLSFINNSVMGSVFSGYKTPALVNLEFKPTFTLELLLKDTKLGLAAAEEAGMTLPISEIVRERIDKALDEGYGGQDFAALIMLTAEEAGIELQPVGAEVSDGLEPVATT